jgi:hypothetical protein
MFQSLLQTLLKSVLCLSVAEACGGDRVRKNRQREICMDWIDLAQDRDQLRALVNTVMNLRVP